MRTVTAAVVGTGFIGPVHVEAIRRLGHRVVGVLGSTPEKSRAAADAQGVEKGYASFAELLADSTVEVIHLASPNAAHFDQCKRAIAAGKHVVCEKPLALTSTETAELVALAASNPQLVTAVNYNIRFYPLSLEARERVRGGDIGDVFHVTGSYLQDWLLHDTDYNWRVEDPTASTRETATGPSAGGAITSLRAVADIGTHWLDLVTFVTGLEVEAVCADLRTVFPTRVKPTGGSETFTSRGALPAGAPVAVTTEDYGSVLVKFAGGPRGCFTVSQVTAGRKNCLRFDIAGAKASLAWDSEQPNTLDIGYRDAANAALTRDPALMGAGVRPYANYPGGHAEGFPDTFKQLYRAVYDAVVSPGSGPRLYPSFADGHREVRVCEAVLKSHREQRWVRV